MMSFVFMNFERLDVRCLLTVVILTYDNIVIPPYSSMGGYLVYCVFLFVSLFVRLRISQWQKEIAA